MNSHRVTTLFAAVLLVLASVGGAGVVTADEDGSFFDDLVSDDGEEGYLASAGIWLAKATGGVSRYWAAYVADGDAADAETYAEDFTSTFNANNETIAQYANQRLTADTDHDVFAVYFHDREDGNVTRYVVSDVENGSWSNVTVLTPDEFDDRNRTSDHYVSLDWYQSRNADAEVETFVEEYAEDETDLSATYKGELLGTYGAPESDMWNTTEDS